MSELSLQEALQRFLKHSRLKSGVQSAQIEDIWESIMGKTIAQYTDSIKIAGNKLLINTSVAPLKTELVYQKEIIMRRVNEELGEAIIKEVIVL